MMMMDKWRVQTGRAGEREGRHICYDLSKTCKCQESLVTASSQRRQVLLWKKGIASTRHQGASQVHRPHSAQTSADTCHCNRQTRGHMVRWAQRNKSHTESEKKGGGKNPNRETEKRKTSLTERQDRVHGEAPRWKTNARSVLAITRTRFLERN